MEIYNSYIPNVIETTNRGERSYDLYSRLLREHIIYISTPINSEVANNACAQLMFLEYENPDRDINLYINSPGGDITGLFAIYDTMKYIKPDVATFVMGQAASAAAIILAGGTKGKRFSLPHSRVLLHQPHGGSGYAQASDLEIQAKEIMRMRDLLNNMLAIDTGQDLAKVAKDTERDFILNANDAKEYGIIDEILTTRELSALPQAPSAVAS